MEPLGGPGHNHFGFTEPEPDYRQEEFDEMKERMEKAEKRITELETSLKSTESMLVAQTKRGDELLWALGYAIGIINFFPVNLDNHSWFSVQWNDVKNAYNKFNVRGKVSE